MDEFTLEYIEEIPGKREFFKLLIDNIWEYDGFEEGIIAGKRYISELKSLQSYIQLHAKLQRIPPKKINNTMR